MRDKLEGLTDVFNMQLKNIKVSEELKLKTLEKCKKNSKNKELRTITCTIAACLLVGIIVYPIYTRNNLLMDESITLDTKDRRIKDRNIKVIDEPYMDSTIVKNKTNIIEDKDSKIIKGGVVDENSNDIDKKREQQKQEIEVATLIKEPNSSKKVQTLTEGEKKDKDNSTENKEILMASTRELIDKEKLSNSDNKNNEVDIKEKDIVLLSENNNLKRNFNEDIKLKSVSLEEAREIFKDNLKNPSYVPKDFILENTLVSETGNSSYISWELIYRNNSQYFKVIKYEDTSNTSELVQDSSIEAKETEKNNNIIYMNNIPVNCIINKDASVENVSYTKLNWENKGNGYVVEGNILEEELINIVISIINQ